MPYKLENFPTKIIRSNRKTLSVEVKADSVLVRAPHKVSNKEIQKFLEEKQNWIEKNLKKLQERQALFKQQEPYTQEEICMLVEKALDVIPQRVRYYAPIVGVDYGRITIRNQRTRWGSCSSKGNLNFNCLLMLFPDEVLDSIVVHELCHRKHMNHSAAFYEEVERVFPEYRRCEKWLKEHGSLYLSRLP